jgi:hypothetical protein
MIKENDTLAQKMFESENEAREALRNFRLLFLLVLLVLALGMIFYRYVEDFTWVNAFYFCIVSLTTVGYGDITPTTDIGKVFTSFYLLVGIGIIAGFINNMVKSRMAKRAIKDYEKLKVASELIKQK